LRQTIGWEPQPGRRRGSTTWQTELSNDCRARGASPHAREDHDRNHGKYKGSSCSVGSAEEENSKRQNSPRKAKRRRHCGVRVSAPCAAPAKNAEQAVETLPTPETRHWIEPEIPGEVLYPAKPSPLRRCGRRSGESRCERK